PPVSTKSGRLHWLFTYAPDLLRPSNGTEFALRGTATTVPSAAVSCFPQRLPVVRSVPMARLWFGGSFNPIHHAHLIGARAVAEARGHEKVVLVPSYQPPHKLLGHDMAPAEDRLAMCQLAVEGSTMFEVDDLELRRGGPSFTIDTVRELKRRWNSQVH